MTRHKTDYQPSDPGSHYLDDIAYWAHTNDLRQATIPVINEPGHDLPGDQKVNIYTFFAFGSVWGREILMSTAKQGGFEDKNGNNIPDNGLSGAAAGPCLADLTGPCEYDKVINATGAPGRDGIPDNFFWSNNVEDMEPQILGALTTILQNAASGTAISVLSTSTSGEGAAYQAYFFPSTPGFSGDVKWVGYTQSLFIDKFGNLREDFSGANCTGPPDGKLILAHDCIVNLRYDATSQPPGLWVDRYKDDGLGTITFKESVRLENAQPVWEAGRRLALTDPGASCAANAGGVACRRILTWADISNGAGVGPSPEEFNEFRADRAAILCPYLGGSLVLDCNSAVPANKTAALNEATDIINFIRGNQVAGLRDRQMTVKDDGGAAVTKVWKLGDIINSTPVVVGAPRERFDVLYGDAGYAQYYRRYKDRRQVAYVGANDGMLHAFNAGFFTLDDTKIDGAGDTVQVRFSVTPVMRGTSTACTALPCDASVAQYAFRTDAPKRGAELWAFIPQDLLPQLRWLTLGSYDHVYYVDLKPKVADARIFADDADHPGGWGTVLIGGFRMGGSCTNCTGSKGGARVVTADFNGDGDTTDDGDTRVFLSSYFVLDITNPEKDPNLLWTFRDQDLGLTTAAPAVVRIKPPNTSADPKTNSANEKWWVIFGTGPTDFDGSSSQTARIFVVDLKDGPKWASINDTTGTKRGKTCTAASPCMAIKTGGINDRGDLFSTGQAGAFMGDAATLDFNLDFRVDVIYAGSVICTGATASPCDGTGPAWRGAMWRLTTNGDTDPGNWGVSGVPTKLISTFACADTTATCGTKVGPIVAAPAMAMDDTNNLWVFFGTGRFYSSLDKADQDPKHFFGVKDCNLTGQCAVGAVEQHDLYDASNVVVCTQCADPAQNVSLDGGSTYGKSFDAGGSSLLNDVGAKSGWFIALEEARERNLTTAVAIGGTLFFTTVFPGTDVCVSEAQGRIYALYYKTGTPYKESSLGESVSSGNANVKEANKSINLGSGVPSGVTVHLGARGTGADGSTNSNQGSVGGLNLLVQMSNVDTKKTAVKAALQPWSRILSWRDV
jgi:type IV pilus assembly protein PilY1